MPLATNPKARFEIVLESDKNLPEEKRPTFIYRYLTGLEQIELANRMDNLGESDSGKKAVEEVFDAAETGLIGWSNMNDLEGNSIPFEPKKLSSILGLSEANELIEKLIRQSPSIEDKKKSVSPSPSSTDKSVKDAKA